MSDMYRQGDVLVIRIGDAPDGADDQDEGREIVLAEGEATGHAHRVAHVFGTRDRFSAPAGTVVTHEEHGHIMLPPGEYEVRRQQVWTPLGTQRVRD